MNKYYFRSEKEFKEGLNKDDEFRNEYDEVVGGGRRRGTPRRRQNEDCKGDLFAGRN